MGTKLKKIYPAQLYGWQVSVTCHYWIKQKSLFHKSDELERETLLRKEEILKGIKNLIFDNVVTWKEGNCSIKEESF